MIPGKISGIIIKNKQKYSSNYGFTLVELIVVMALLLIVLDLGYMFFSYGVNTYKGGENQSNVQREIRLASGYITRELRKSTSMDVSFAVATPSDINYCYLIFDPLNEEIKFYDEGVLRYSINKCFKSFAFSVNFINGKYVMNFEITGTEGDRVYNTISKVLLVNMKTLPTGITKDTKYTIEINPDNPDAIDAITIKFKKP